MLVVVLLRPELLAFARGERSTDDRSGLRVGLSWFFVGLSWFFVGLSWFFVGLSEFKVGLSEFKVGLSEFKVVLSEFKVGLSVGENNVPIAFDFAKSRTLSLLQAYLHFTACAKG